MLNDGLGASIQGLNAEGNGKPSFCRIYLDGMKGTYTKRGDSWKDWRIFE